MITPLQFYIDQGAYWTFDFESKDPDVNEAMHEVILNSLDWLIENGANPNQCGPQGLVALDIAVALKREELYRKWVSLGADPSRTCTSRKDVLSGPISR